MLIPQRFHEGIRNGDVTLAFRRWKRPTVRAGGTLQTAAGLLAIDDLVEIDEADISPADARAAGFSSVEQLVGTLRPGEDRTLYRIRFQCVGDDPRLALRADDRLDESDLVAISEQLERWDAASRSGPWTRRTLQVLASRPGEPSRALAEQLQDDQARLKRRIRQLKGLGLTESLSAGYGLSDRGRAFLEHCPAVP